MSPPPESSPPFLGADIFSWNVTPDLCHCDRRESIPEPTNLVRSQLGFCQRISLY